MAPPTEMWFLWLPSHTNPSQNYAPHTGPLLAPPTSLGFVFPSDHGLCNKSAGGETKFKQGQWSSSRKQSEGFESGKKLGFSLLFLSGVTQTPCHTVYTASQAHLEQLWHHKYSKSEKKKYKKWINTGKEGRRNYYKLKICLRQPFKSFRENNWFLCFKWHFTKDLKE